MIFGKTNRISVEDGNIIIQDVNNSCITINLSNPGELEEHILQQFLFSRQDNRDKEGRDSLVELANGIEISIKSGKVTGVKEKLRKLEGMISYNENLLGLFHFIDANCDKIVGEYQESIKKSYYAMRFFKDDITMQRKTYLLLADTYRLKSQYEESFENYKKVIELCKNRTNDRYAKKELSNSLLGIAKLNRLRCSYTRSLDWYRKAFHEFEAHRDHTGISETYFGMGEVCRLLSNYSDSLENYKKSFAKAKEDDNFERQAYSLWGIGEILRIAGNCREAEEKHIEGIELCRLVGDTRSRGWGLVGLAEISAKQGNYDKSQQRYMEALSLFQRTESQTEIAHALLGIAETNRMQGKIDIESYNNAIKIYGKLKMDHCLLHAILGKYLCLRLNEDCKLIYEAQAEKLVKSADFILKRNHELRREANFIDKLIKIPNPYEKIELSFP
jgi:tetratricopeptide (TPR) repeat protein